MLQRCGWPARAEPYFFDFVVMSLRIADNTERRSIVARSVPQSLDVHSGAWPLE
jgi:hypothetical protein